MLSKSFAVAWLFYICATAALSRGSGAKKTNRLPNLPSPLRPGRPDCSRSKDVRFSLVSNLTSQVSRLTSQVSRLTSQVSRPKSQVSLHLEQRAIGIDFVFEFVTDIQEILFG